MIDPSKHRIFLVDDHPLVREWLTNLINQQPDLAVCGEAEDAPHALEAIAKLKPDVAIVDLSLKYVSGLDLIKDLKLQQPEVLVLVLSMHDEALYAERAIRAGARGYIMKRETAKKVISAIRQVVAGELCVSESFAAVMAQKFLMRTPATGSPVQLLRSRIASVSIHWPGLRDAPDRRVAEREFQNRPILLRPHQGKARAQ